MKRTTLDYRDGAVDLRGVLLRDEARTGRRPGVVLFPDARGIGDHAVECAARLAALGFVVLVADLYGGGVTARDVAQAHEWMGRLRADVERWRARAEAARHALAQQDGVDLARMAAIGHCFGGTTVLELARSGAPLLAVVSFHGGLSSPRPDDAANIKGEVLVCHGAADVLVPMTQLHGFTEDDDEDHRRLAGANLWRRRPSLHQSGGRRSARTPNPATIQRPTSARGGPCFACSTKFLVRSTKVRQVKV